LQEYFEHFIRTSIDEVHEDYTTAMKQAILDYVLTSPLERQRLGLDGLQPLLVPRMPAQAAAATAGGSSSSSSSTAVLGMQLVPSSHAALVQRQLPPEWREHVAMARCGQAADSPSSLHDLTMGYCLAVCSNALPANVVSSTATWLSTAATHSNQGRKLACYGSVCREDIAWTLQTLNPNALELNRLWHEHGYATAVRLLDVASADLLERLPVKVSSRALRTVSNAPSCRLSVLVTSTGQ
jgi:hypothetical protein